MKDSRVKMKHILSKKETFKKLFLDKSKYIKFSLQLFFTDPRNEKQIFMSPEDPLVKEYLEFIEKELIPKCISAMALI